MIAELINVSKYFQTPGTENRREVLDNISLQINSGDSIAIVGPSGSGKSTLLNITGTLDKPGSGTVKIRDSEIINMKEKDLAKIRNQEIGFVFQEHHLLPQLNLIENILVPTIPVKDRNMKEKAKARAVELLDHIGLSERIHQLPGQMSGGECQRAAVIRALINEPQLLLADEPTGSLDLESAENLGELLVDINKKQNVAIVVVTHSLELAKKMDVIYRIINGKLEKVSNSTF